MHRNTHTHPQIYVYIYVCVCVCVCLCVCNVYEDRSPPLYNKHFIIPDILIKFWLAPFGAKTISLLIKPAPFGAKISWAFHLKCSSPFYSWSASLDRISLNFLYINSCFGFNKLLMNLTSLCQHHLQYNFIKKDYEHLRTPNIHYLCRVALASLRSEFIRLASLTWGQLSIISIIEIIMTSFERCVSKKNFSRKFSGQSKQKIKTFFFLLNRHII